MSEVVWVNVVRGVSRAFQRPALVATLAFGLTACGGDPPTDPGPGDDDDGGGWVGDVTEVKATDALVFMDQLVEIPAGNIVRWVSQSNLPHTVTPIGHGEFERAEVTQRGAVILLHGFDTPGVYEYECEFHGELGMRGTIIVSPP